MFSKSHTRAVVRECCKEDDQSQWGSPEKAKFDTRPPLDFFFDIFGVKKIRVLDVVCVIRLVI